MVFYVLNEGEIVKKSISFLLFFALFIFPQYAFPNTIDVLIKGIDDGVKTNKQQDYKEAVMNAKLEAIERAGIEISSITKMINFKFKYDKVESKAQAVLMPGFRVMDLGYQTDGTYSVVLSGKVRTGKKVKKKQTKIIGTSDELKNYLFDAVKNGDIKTVKGLLSQGVYVNCKNNKGSTPLFFASNTSIAKLLIANGAQVNVKNNSGLTPIEWAVVKKNNKLLRLFMKQKPRKDFTERAFKRAYLAQNKTALEIITNGKVDLNLFFSSINCWRIYPGFFTKHPTNPDYFDPIHFQTIPTDQKMGSMKYREFTVSGYEWRKHPGAENRPDTKVPKYKSNIRCCLAWSIKNGNLVISDRGDKVLQFPINNELKTEYLDTKGVYKLITYSGCDKWRHY